METVQSKHKSYVNQKRKFLEFAEKDYVFLKVTPTTEVKRTIKSNKLIPKFIGPY
uniref:Uncharacterized protein n=1 Tax=Cajanus cajan TaxID=3821 RepID=A0A151SEK5_CAJCA|nr:hypothetical protein KK1_024852 [Cajanus cajan]